MKLIWTFSRLPELEHLSEAQRAKLLRATRGAYLTMWWRAMGAGALLAVIVATLIGRLTDPLLSVYAFPCLMPLAIGLLFQVQMRKVRIELHRTLIDRSRGEMLPACLRCGYNMQDAPTDYCPECGALCRVPASE